MIKRLSQSNQNELTKEASDIIKQGGVVVLPFDTVYGFACDAKNNKAIEKIYALKNRPLNQTMGVAVSDIDQIDIIARVNHRDFLKTRLPGQFTFILPKKEQKISHYCYKNQTIGIRVPNNQFILELIKQSGGVIVQTSANKTGQLNCLSIDNLKNHFDKEEIGKIDLIIDGGKIDQGKPSDLWDLTKEVPVLIER